MKIRIRYILLLIIVIILVLNLFPKESFGSRGFDEFIYVTVSKGDTLWSIAKNHNYIKTDIREVIYYIEKINNIENKYIHPGQVIAIPVK